jgi:hypothetical protein
MSRAINIRAEMDVVVGLCGQHDIGISAIEPLTSGGTRVVLMTAEGAASLRQHAKKELIDGPVVRSGVYQARPPIRYA